MIHVDNKLNNCIVVFGTSYKVIRIAQRLIRVIQYRNIYLPSEIST